MNRNVLAFLVLVGLGLGVVFFIKPEKAPQAAGVDQPVSLFPEDGLLPVHGVTTSRKDKLKARLTELAETDPLGALERIPKEIDDFWLRSFAYQSLFDAWLAIDHHEAALHIDRSTQPEVCAYVDVKNRTLYDLDGVWAWMLSRSTFPDGERDLTVIVSRAIRSDIGATTARIEAIEDPEIRARASWAAAYYWPFDKNLAAAVWAMGLPTEQCRDTALTGLLVRFHGLLERFHDSAEVMKHHLDMAIAKRLTLGLSLEKRTESIRSMMHSLEREQGSEYAIVWLSEFEDVLDPSTYANDFAGLWSRSKGAHLPAPSEFADYGAPLQKAMVRALSSVQRPIDEKLAWLKTMNDEALEIEALQVMAEYNHGEGRDIVAKAIEARALESDSPEFRDVVLLGLVESANEHRDFRESLRLAALIAEPAIRHEKIERALSVWSYVAGRVYPGADHYEEGQAKRLRLLAEGRSALLALDLPDELASSLEEKYFRNP